MIREGIDITASPLETMAQLSEGNPGALMFMMTLKDHFKDNPYQPNFNATIPK